MKSKASIKGHSIHPILIAFPVAFFTGTLIFDILALVLDEPVLWQTGYFMEIAGVISGLIAAVPGIIDYFFTVPPKSSARKAAATHGILNVLLVIIFFIAWLIRRHEDASVTIIIGLEVIGLILLTITGWMGGTLINRNQISVNIMQANATEWSEEYIKKRDGKMQVSTSSGLKTNQMKLIHVNNKRIVIARTEKGCVAFDDRCTHKGASLSGGVMMCSTVHCPWHGSQFDVNTGAIKCGPAKEKIETYSVSESNGKIYLNL